jgi:plasmid rolling circle replication initiator protein Rep
MKNTKKDPNSQTKKEQSFNDLLRDYKKSGKLRDWDKRKTQTNAVAKACSETVGLERYGERMCECGKNVEFEACIIPEHGKKIKRANFCNYRMCPMCQPRKAAKVRNEVFDLAKAHLDHYKDDIPLLLTLTVPNITGENIGREIDSLMKAFERLIKRKTVKQMNRSWFKAMEITKNHNRGDYHPHFHVMLMVPPEYFHKNSPLYITRDEWLKLWQEAKRDSSITQVDIRALKGTGEQKLEAIIAEVAKYATKPSSYLITDKFGNEVVDNQALDDLHWGLKGRRTIGYGGYFKKVRKELRLQALEKSARESEESLNEDGTPKEKEPSRCRECNRQMVTENYSYLDRIKRYFRIRPHNHGPGNHSPP